LEFTDPIQKRRYVPKNTKITARTHWVYLFDSKRNIYLEENNNYPYADSNR
jgi:hypothetical protein